MLPETINELPLSLSKSGFPTHPFPVTTPKYKNTYESIAVKRLSQNKIYAFIKSIIKNELHKSSELVFRKASLRPHTALEKWAELFRMLAKSRCYILAKAAPPQHESLNVCKALDPSSVFRVSSFFLLAQLKGSLNAGGTLKVRKLRCRKREREEL